jgi:hypothetical protein
LSFHEVEMALVVLPAMGIDLGFCGADDHILVGVGGNRFGVYPEYYTNEEGLFFKLELWCSEEDLFAAIDALVEDRDPASPDVLEVLLRGWKGARAKDELKGDLTLRQETKNRLVRELRSFRNGPWSAYVAQQTDHFRGLRRPDPVS